MENEAVKPQIATARKLARKIIEEMGVQKPPIRINDIYKHLKQNRNNRVEITSFNFGENTDGQTVEIEGSSLVGYNDDKHIHRKRFTVAHELGHMLLGHTNTNSSHEFDVYDGEGFDPKEVEANQFAAELLIPLLLVKKEIESGTTDIEELARIFWVSKEAMFRKIINSGLLNKI
jgi:Zn-dependent peptidase ImmA (M78 family)